jgi:putative transposase
MVYLDQVNERKSAAYFQENRLMPGPKPLCVTLSDKQRGRLDHLLRRQTSRQRLVRRAKTILAAADGASNEAIAAHRDLDRTTVRTWRQRWWSGADTLAAAEAAGEADKALRLRIAALLDEAPRSGTPGEFSAEQLTPIISVACEAPEDSGRPVSHGTPRQLADEVINRGIVQRISPRTVGRFLKRRRSQAPSLDVLAQSSTGSRPRRV